MHPDYPVEGYVMTHAELQLHGFPVPLRDAAGGAEAPPPGFVSSAAAGKPATPSAAVNVYACLRSQHRASSVEMILQVRQIETAAVGVQPV